MILYNLREKNTVEPITLYIGYLKMKDVQACRTAIFQTSKLHAVVMTFHV